MHARSLEGGQGEGVGGWGGVKLPLVAKHTVLQSYVDTFLEMIFDLSLLHEHVCLYVYLRPLFIIFMAFCSILLSIDWRYSPSFCLQVWASGDSP